mgnify:CR=1 FL=1
MDWQGEAAKLIAQVHAELPDSASLADRKKACREAGGWHFHGGTSWGKKVWAKHTRRYLEKFGLPPLQQKHQPTFGPDICFPFREE